VGHKPALVLVNKHDLPSKLTPELLAGILPEAPRLAISALTTAGIDQLEEALVDLILGGRVSVADTPLVSNPRHKALLQQAVAHTQAAIEAQKAGLSADLVSIDLRAATEALGEITGETVTEDLLETIFSNFCIGK
jgi:tRNA modification GTPase